MLDNLKIVYCSNASHTKRYAEMLGKKLNIEVIDIKKVKTISKKSNIIYMSWIFGNNVVNLNKIVNKYNIYCIVGVGMNKESNNNTNLIIDTNKIKTPFFYLQGGLDYTKLKGIKRMMIKMVSEQVIKENKEKDQEIIEIFRSGKDCVRKENLKQIEKFLIKDKTI